MKTFKLFLLSSFLLGQFMVFSFMIFNLFDFLVYFFWRGMNAVLELYSGLIIAGYIIVDLLPSSKSSGKKESSEKEDILILSTLLITVINAIILLCYFGFEEFLTHTFIPCFLYAIIAGVIRTIIDMDDETLEKLNKFAEGR